MAITKANILSEAYTVYIADTTTTAPEVDDCTGGSVEFGVDWVQCYTEGPVKLEYEGEMQGIRINGFLSDIKKILTGETAKVSFAVAEEDLRMFNYCISASTLTAVSPGASQCGQDVLTVGDGPIVEKQLALVGTNPEGNDRVIVIPVAVASGSFANETQVEHTAVPVEFEVLNDCTSAAGARLMTIYDLTADPA